MTVDSSLELFTTLFGWLFYDFIWAILTKTGILLIPFIGIVLNAFITSRLQGSSSDTVLPMIRRLELRLFIAFFVLLFAGQPIVTLSVNEVSYTPRSIRGLPTQQEFAHENNTTYGSISFKNHPNAVKVPLLWYAVLQAASGINRAVIEAVPPIADYRSLTEQMRLTNIEDDQLRAQLQKFYTACFMPARSKFHNEKPDTAVVREIFEEHGADDPDYIGSQLYMTRPGYYDTLRPAHHVKGFPYNETRDKEWDVDDPNRPEFGRPTCREWWNNLKPRIVNQASNVDGFLEFLGGSWNESKRHDVLVKSILSKDPPSIYKRGVNYAHANGIDADGNIGMLKSIYNSATGVVEWAGLLHQTALHETSMSVILKLEHPFQALILMSIYIVLPFLILFTAYRLEVLLIGSILLFTIKLWTLLWFFAFWIDNNLLLAMYPDTESLASFFGGNDMSNQRMRMLLNILVGSLHILFPLILAIIAGYAGVRMSGATHLFLMQTGAYQTAAVGANRTTRRGATGAARQAKGK
ncbi:conjugal transfer protein TraG N-terminal domain-containing protein [Endozoicomonas sp. SM1973]|uniref:Conjugal transfer protein TraG N-terminal domain-containing protein n=1 Tax=Spartinivicinus marinus TaxID=2994442 RepID=A0A853I344_9GAMM|nr:conjugal transfer protein TraG N-terminal domain-containing protein [Spartinivicinus marinus]MCX4030170.1 conjugal transfer protein TraG N-terminal domain-containing protein [Spartinivicinus marinus]NYZ67813.1 conjugal transfer protein TraG N-terminal domain-containing protein [Spartinivicinus marinus]